MSWDRTAAFVLAVLVALVAPAAHAGPGSSGSDQAAALALFNEGRELMTAGQHEQACGRFAESLRLAEGAGTRFNLAECQERTGRLASAWVNYVRVSDATERSGEHDRAAVARARAEALEPRVPRLQIDVTAPVPEMRVTRDGVPFEPAHWGAALPVDLGRHVIAVTAPGHRPHQETIDVTQEGRTVVVRLGPLEPAPRPTPAPPPPGTSTAAPVPTPSGPTPPEPGPSSDGPSATLTGAYVSLGIAGALTIATVVVGGLALGKQADYEQAIDDRDMPAAQSALDDGETLNVTTDVLLGVTVATAAAALVLFLVDEGAGTEAGTAVHLAPLGGPTAAGLVVTGGF